MRILVYPFGTEIAFEIYRSLCHVKNITLYGGTSDNNNHGFYVYDNVIADLPFISDSSTREDVESFARQIEKYDFDFIYPAMDGCVTKFAEFRGVFSATVIASEFSVAEITRSKSKTYSVLKDCIRIPVSYKDLNEIPSYPVFVKPDVGQGSAGAKKISSEKELEEALMENPGLLVLEYLPGEEYTVDCFTNSDGELIFACCRKRLRMKNGISVSCDLFHDDKITEIAEKINERIRNKGGWFFQLKKDASGEYVLLEVASRIAGTSGFTRCMGANLPLLTLYTFQGQCIKEIPVIGHKKLHIDRALYNAYKTDIEFDSVYVDWDDTIVVNGHLNMQLIAFLYSCIDSGKPVYLLTRHDNQRLGNLNALLAQYHLSSLFTEILHIGVEQKKSDYIRKSNCIFIDDSYGERMAVRESLGIPVFDPSMIEALVPFNHIL